MSFDLEVNRQASSNVPSVRFSESPDVVHTYPSEEEATRATGRFVIPLGVATNIIGALRKCGSSIGPSQDVGSSKVEDSDHPRVPPSSSDTDVTLDENGVAEEDDDNGEVELPGGYRINEREDYVITPDGLQYPHGYFYHGELRLRSCAKPDGYQVLGVDTRVPYCIRGRKPRPGADALSADDDYREEDDYENDEDRALAESTLDAARLALARRRARGAASKEDAEGPIAERKKRRHAPYDPFARSTTPLAPIPLRTPRHDIRSRFVPDESRNNNTAYATSRFSPGTFLTTGGNPLVHDFFWDQPVRVREGFASGADERPENNNTVIGQSLHAAAGAVSTTASAVSSTANAWASDIASATKVSTKKLTSLSSTVFKATAKKSEDTDEGTTSSATPDDDDDDDSIPDLLPQPPAFSLAKVKAAALKVLKTPAQLAEEERLAKEEQDRIEKEHRHQMKLLAEEEARYRKQLDLQQTAHLRQKTFVPPDDWQPPPPDSERDLTKAKYKRKFHKVFRHNVFKHHHRHRHPHDHCPDDEDDAHTDANTEVEAEFEQKPSKRKKFKQDLRSFVEKLHRHHRGHHLHGPEPEPEPQPERKPLPPLDINLDIPSCTTHTDVQLGGPGPLDGVPVIERFTPTRWADERRYFDPRRAFECLPPEFQKEGYKPCPSLCEHVDMAQHPMFLCMDYTCDSRMVKAKKSTVPYDMKKAFRKLPARYQVKGYIPCPCECERRKEKTGENCYAMCEQYKRLYLLPPEYCDPSYTPCEFMCEGGGIRCTDECEARKAAYREANGIPPPPAPCEEPALPPPEPAHAHPSTPTRNPAQQVFETARKMVVGRFRLG